MPDEILDTTSGVTETAQVSAPSTGAAGSPPEQSTTAPPSETSPQGVTTGSQETKEPTTESDPFAGLPTAEELAAAVEKKVPYAEGLQRVRAEYDKIAPQYKELTTQFEPLKPVIDRMGSPEEVTSWIDARDELYKQRRTDEGDLVPDPSGFAQRISTDAPVTADYLASQLIWGNTVDQRTGQQVQRIVPLLESIATEPTIRAQALKILGAVEPSQIPQPTWTATADELDKIASLGLDENKTVELQDAYKKLPYETREEIRLNSPEFIKSFVEDQQFKAQTRARDEAEQTRQQQEVERERTAFREAQATAGAQYIDQTIREGFNGLVQGIVKDWQPTDDPAMNKVAASFVGVVTTALAHGETRFAGEVLLGALKEMGIPVDLSPFDKSLKSYVDQARNYGELDFVAQRQRNPAAPPNGNGNGDRGITYYKTEANRGLQTLQAHSRNVAGSLMKALDKFFVTRANAHNETLDSATGARPVIQGAPASASGGNPLIGKPASQHPWSS